METKYKIIGGDGREYGPVTLDEIKGWIRDGRVGPQTQLLRSDLNQWLPAMQFQELQAELPALSPTATLEGQAEPVGFWARVGASLIDGILISILFTFLFVPVAKMMNVPVPTEAMISKMTQTDIMEQFAPLVRFVYGFVFVLTALYEIALTGKFGTTVGKMIFGAQITRLNGTRLGFGYAALRFFGKIVSGLVCYIGYIMVAFRDDKRGLHDLIASTRVIYKR